MNLKIKWYILTFSLFVSIAFCNDICIDSNSQLSLILKDFLNSNKYSTFSKSLNQNISPLTCTASFIELTKSNYEQKCLSNYIQCIQLPINSVFFCYEYKIEFLYYFLESKSTKFSL